MNKQFHDNKMVLMVGGPAIASAVFIAGPTSDNTTLRSA